MESEYLYDFIVMYFLLQKCKLVIYHFTLDEQSQSQFAPSETCPEKQKLESTIVVELERPISMESESKFYCYCLFINQIDIYFQ